MTGGVSVPRKRRMEESASRGAAPGTRTIFAEIKHGGHCKNRFANTLGVACIESFCRTGDFPSEIKLR